MPEFVKNEGEESERRVGAPSGSILEDVLLRKGWQQVDGSELEPVNDPSEGEPDEDQDDPNADLKGLKRGELEEIAEDLGIENVAEIPNVPAVVEAIVEARKEADNG